MQVLQHSIYLAFGQGSLSSCRSPLRTPLGSTGSGAPCASDAAAQSILGKMRNFPAGTWHVRARLKSGGGEGYWPNAPCRTVCTASPARRPGDESWLAGLDEADRRGAPKTRRTVRHTYSCIWVAARLLATAAAGVGNACSLSFREAPRLGRQARGKRACRTIALRHDER